MTPETADREAGIRVVPHASAEYWQAVELRRRILRRPLGLDLSDQELADESGETHIVALAAGVVVGCLVMVPHPHGLVKMRQVAVKPEFQGRGLGGRLVSFSEEWARSQGFRAIELNARETAVEFYLRLGYGIVGLPFEEVSIPHLKMVKTMPER